MLAHNFWHLLIVIFIGISQNLLIAHHKIIYLISPPRSLSVAFLRMMQARGDFEIFVEPSHRAFGLHYFKKTGNRWFSEEDFLASAPTTFNEVKHQILESAAHKPVFVKEMGYTVAEFLTQDTQDATELIKNSNVYFFFLIRNPHHSMISFYRKICNCTSADLAHTIEYESCMRLFNSIKDRVANPPRIIFSENLYANPEETIKQFCEYCTIPVLDHALKWPSLGQDFTGIQAWHERRAPWIIQWWYTEAMRSTGFHKPHEYAVDVDGNPTFIEIAEIHRAAYQKAYQENLEYYNQLKAYIDYHL